MDNDYVLIAKAVGVHGLQGWLKLESYTESRGSIRSFSPWYIAVGDHWEAIEVTASVHGNRVRGRPEGVDSVTAAQSWLGREFFVKRTQLPRVEQGTFYWNDLVGCEVRNQHGEVLGRVKRLFETGGNDVMVVVRDGSEHLVPFVYCDYVTAVNVADGTIEVDWNLDS